MPKSIKTNTTIRLSDEAREIMRALSAKLGISQSSVMELALRRLAEAEGFSTQESIDAFKRRFGVEPLSSKEITKAGGAKAGGAKTRAFPAKPKAK
jgi:predicted nucleic acid-binding protein